MKVIGLFTFGLFCALLSIACGEGQGDSGVETPASETRVFDLLAGTSQNFSVNFEWVGSMPPGTVGRFSWSQSDGVRRLDAIWDNRELQGGVFTIQEAFYPDVPPIESASSWECSWQQNRADAPFVSCTEGTAASPPIFTHVLNALDAIVLGDVPDDFFAGHAAKCFRIRLIGNAEAALCVDSSTKVPLFFGVSTGDAPAEVIRATGVSLGTSSLKPAFLESVAASGDVERVLLSDLLLPQ